MITIIQIAQEAGVAKSTVSRYLNQGSVSSATAKKIEAVIAKHNYTPNEFAQNLKSKKSKFLGVIVPRINSPSMMKILDGIDKQARDDGYQMLISNTELETAREIESIQALVSNRVAGIILLATEITPQHLATAQGIEIPLLFVGQSHPDVFSVDHDNYRAGQQLVEQVAQFGHEKVLYIGVPEEDQAVGVFRKAGVIETFAEKGITVAVQPSTFYAEDNYQLGKEILATTEAELIITATDSMAMGIIKAAHELEVKIGQDLSIAGFGGYSFGEYLYPELTTVDFDYYAVGQRSAGLLNQQIKGEAIPQRTLIPTNVILRHSVIAKKNA